MQCKCLVSSEEDKKYGLIVNTVGFKNMYQDFYYPKTDDSNECFFDKCKILNQYQLIYITEGSGALIIESTQLIQISKGNLVLIFPGQYYSCYPTHSSGWNVYYIGCTGKIFENLVENSFFSKENQLMYVGLNDELVTLYKRAIEISQMDKVAMQQHLLGIVMHMVGLVISESSNNKMDFLLPKQIIENAKIIMNEHIFDTLYPEDIAIKLDVNYTTFRKLFKSTTGFSPAKYYQALKIQKAKQYLLETPMSIKEITYKLKFYSPENFNNSFKKYTGEAPSKYRQSRILYNISK